jgi:hypothetical protein
VKIKVSINNLLQERSLEISPEGGELGTTSKLPPGKGTIKIADRELGFSKKGKSISAIAALERTLGDLKTSTINGRRIKPEHIALTLSLLDDNNIKDLQAATRNINAYSKKVQEVSNDIVGLYNGVVNQLDNFFMRAEAAALGAKWLSALMGAKGFSAAAGVASGPVAAVLGLGMIIPTLYANGQLADLEKSEIEIILMDIRPLLEAGVKSRVQLASVLKKADPEFMESTKAHELVRYLLPTKIPGKGKYSSASGKYGRYGAIDPVGRPMARTVPNAEEARRVIQNALVDGTIQDLYDNYSRLARRTDKEEDQMDLIDITLTVPDLKDLSSKIEKSVQKSASLLSPEEAKKAMEDFMSGLEPPEDEEDLGNEEDEKNEN